MAERPREDRGAAFDPEVKAHLDADRARKEELRNQPNVVLLEDWRQNGCGQKPHFC
jgi:hypothetical protein